MKIKNLEIVNFKLFDEKFDEINDISKTDLVLFNGPNGYGKTTIFDAVEFALTGKIERVLIYNKDLGITKSEKFKKKILITDPLKDAYVLLTLENDECNITLERYYYGESDISGEKLSAENNPNKIFEYFERKVWVNDEEIIGEEEQNMALAKYHLDNLEEYFNRCCFLSQDEHLQFLKEAKKNKTAALDFLFCLPEKKMEEAKKLDAIITQLKNANKAHDIGYIKKIENKIKELKEEIDILKGKNAKVELDEENEYQCLFPERNIKWDEKECSLTDDEFDEADNEINKLIFYSQNQNYCENYIWNRPYIDLLKPFSGEENIHYKGHALEYTYRYYPLLQKLGDIEEKYQKQQKLQQLKQHLVNREIGKVNWEFISNENLMQDDSILLAKSKIENIENLKKIQGGVEKVITAIVEKRTVLIKDVKSAMERDIIEKNKCPLCGEPYSTDALWASKIMEEEQELLSLSKGATKEIQESIDTVYKDYFDELNTKVEKLLNASISEALYTQCKEVEKEKIYLDSVKELLKKINIKLPESYIDNITELARGYESLKKEINCKLKIIPEEIIEQLEAKKFLLDYDKYYDKNLEKFELNTCDILEKKRICVKKQYYSSNQKLILQKEAELKKIELRNKKINEIYLELKTYRDAIDEGIKEYKSSVIHDIEPLLHVYTAKILQQKFNGKSIFISTEKDMSNFQLVHSAEDKQDILYNMSSGQLAAVSLSFLLCMNQVYAQQQSLPILLIDDPIQTIDDVNMVGLVDILRFEFANTQLFISTHEQKFEWFLKYKYEMAKRKIDSYNMKNILLRTNRICE